VGWTERQRKGEQEALEEGRSECEAGAGILV
jgi:hypothetical protein